MPSSSTSTSGTARPARAARAHRVGFEPHRAGRAGPTRRVAPQDQVVAVGGERPRLAGRAAAQLLELLDRRPRPRTGSRPLAVREPSSDIDVRSRRGCHRRPGRGTPRVRAPVSSPYAPARHALGDARHHALAPVAQRDVRPHVAVDLVDVVVGGDRRVVLGREPLVVVVRRELAVADRTQRSSP